MQSTSKNTVAKILKVYGVLNGAVGTIFGIYVAADWEAATGIIIIAAALVVRFGIYAFGEVVSLLSDIRANTGANASANAPASSSAQPAPFDDLPEL